MPRKKKNKGKAPPKDSEPKAAAAHEVPPQDDDIPQVQAEPVTDQQHTQPKAVYVAGDHHQSEPPPSPSADDQHAASPVSPAAREVHEIERVQDSFRRLAINEKFPRRPDDGGRLGKTMRLITNCYEVAIPDGFIYHYDVEIINETQRKYETATSSDPSNVKKKFRCLSTKLNRLIITQMIQCHPQFRGYYPAYDGQKNLYTRKELKGTPYKLKVTLDDAESMVNASGDGRKKTESFIVNVKPVSKADTKSCAINLHPVHEFFRGKCSTVSEEAIMALETVLRNGPCLRLTPVGRSFFIPPTDAERNALPGCREIWFGFHQSTHIGQWNLMLNVDTSATIFQKEAPVMEYICDILNCRETDLRRIPMLSKEQINILNKQMRDLRIEISYNSRGFKRKAKLFRFTEAGAKNITFTMSVENRDVETTVEKYYLDRYRIKLNYPQLPCIQIYPKTKKTYIPMEICKVLKGQPCKKELTEDQRREITGVTVKPPDERFAAIQNVINDNRYNEDPYCKEFGIRVSNNPVQCDGRQLNPPKICYKNQQNRVQPRNGSWNMRDQKFFRGVQIKVWALVSFVDPRFCNDSHLSSFAHLFLQICEETGITAGNPVSVSKARPAEVDLVLKNIQMRFKPDLVVIVIPDKNNTLHTQIKQASELLSENLGLKTQCVKEKNVKKPNGSVINGICQKINAKLGGINNILTPEEQPKIFEKPVIIMGADVNHAAPTEKVKASFAAVVGSIDRHPSRYAVECRAQENIDETKQSVEIIKDLRAMVKALLLAFFRNTGGKKPERIIFYRDGVSDGQFDKVQKKEVSAIRHACTDLSPLYKPSITFIIVKKRHHIRFMPRNPREGAGKMGNIPPGTVVDRIVTSPINFDFFLCSHFGLLGTSRPGHYTVIEDDNKFSSDELQKLTHYLCYTFTRCMKSVSAPAPVMYAHLAAYRASEHFRKEAESDIESDDGLNIHLSQSVIESIVVVEAMKDKMYFV